MVSQGHGVNRAEWTYPIHMLKHADAEAEAAQVDKCCMRLVFLGPICFWQRQGCSLDSSGSVTCLGDIFDSSLCKLNISVCGWQSERTDHVFLLLWFPSHSLCTTSTITRMRSCSFGERMQSASRQHATRLQAGSPERSCCLMT